MDVAIVGNNVEAMLCASLFPGSVLVGKANFDRREVYYLPRSWARHLGFRTKKLRARRVVHVPSLRGADDRPFYSEKAYLLHKGDPFGDPLRPRPSLWSVFGRFAVVDGERLYRTLLSVLEEKRVYHINRPPRRFTHRTIEVEGLGEVPTDMIVSTVPLSLLSLYYPHAFNGEYPVVNTYSIPVRGGLLKEDFHFFYDRESVYRIDHYGHDHLVHGTFEGDFSSSVLERVDDLFGYRGGYFGDRWFMGEPFFGSLPGDIPDNTDYLGYLKKDRIYSIGRSGTWRRSYTLQDLWDDSNKIAKGEV